MEGSTHTDYRPRRKTHDHHVPGAAPAAHERDDFEAIVVEPVSACELPNEELFQQQQTDLKKQMTDSKKRIAEIDAELVELQAKRNAALEVLKPTAGLLRKVKANKAEKYEKLEENKIQQEQVNAALAQEKESLKLMKKQLPYGSEEEINTAVAQLESQISQSGLSIRDEKAIISRIRSVKAKKADLQAYQEKETAFKRRPDIITPLREAKNRLFAELQEIRNQEKSLASQVDSLRAELDVVTQNLQNLREERLALYESRKKIKTHIETEQAEFAQQVIQFQQYQRWLRYKRYITNKKIREEKEAYRKQKQQEREAELAKLDPYQEQKDLLSAMKGYLQKFVADERAREGEEEGQQRREMNVEDEWGFGGFAVQRKGKTKKAKKSQSKQQIIHSPDVFADFTKLGLQVPMNVQEVPKALEEVEKRQKFYENAPHPKKLKEIEEARKLADAEIAHRRSSSEFTRTLFEKERARVLAEQKLEEGVRHQDYLEHQRHRTAAAIHAMEAARAERVKEEIMSKINSEILRRVNQKIARELLLEEQARRVQELKQERVLEQLIRRARIAEATRLRQNLEFESADIVNDSPVSVVELVEQEQRRRIAERALHNMLERHLRKLSVEKVIIAAEEERTRRVKEQEALAQFDRSAQIQAVIDLAEQERGRRIVGDMGLLESGREPELVLFLRQNIPNVPEV